MNAHPYELNEISPGLSHLNSSNSLVRSPGKQAFAVPIATTLQPANPRPAFRGSEGLRIASPPGCGVCKTGHRNESAPLLVTRSLDGAIERAGQEGRATPENK